MRSLFQLAILLWFSLAFQAPATLAFGAKPATKEAPPDEESKFEVVATAAKMTLPQKVPYLAGSAVFGSMDYMVHKLFNETHRQELRHEKGNYKKTLLYGGK